MVAAPVVPPTISLPGKETKDGRAIAGPLMPEPAQLYGLICLAFVRHVPLSERCVQCHAPWPCEQVRLAYRLREGF